jgi:hypothetical protein
VPSYVTGTLRRSFEAWHVHFYERLLRYHDYLHDRTVHSYAHRTSSHDITELLASEIKTLAKSFLQAADNFFDARPSDLEDDSGTFFSSLLNLSRDFKRQHLYLRHVPLPWVDRKLELYLETLPTTVGQDVALPQDWSAVLSSQYNFANVIPRGGVAASLPSVLKLPVVERDNCLFWANLLHEYGHMVARDRITRPSIAELPSYNSLSLGHQTHLLTWRDEIIADLIAVDLGGPAYYYAFALFSIFWCQEPLRAPSSKYPPPNTRYRYIKNRVLTNCASTGGDEHFMFADSLWTDRLMLDNLDRGLREKQHDNLGYVAESRGSLTQSTWPSDQAVLQLAEEITGLETYQGASGKQFNDDAYRNSLDLYKQLCASRVVASSRIASLDEAAERFGSRSQGTAISSSRRRESLSLDAIRDKFGGALELLRETPNDPQHIVLAGVLRHVDSMRHPKGSRALAQLFHSGWPEKDHLESRDDLEFRLIDGLVGKSILGSNVAAYYGAADRGD